MPIWLDLYIRVDIFVSCSEVRLAWPCLWGVFFISLSVSEICRIFLLACGFVISPYV